MPKTLFLIDGHSLAYQSYHAVPGLTSPDGRPTGAVYGFVRALDKFTREMRPDRLAVVFDGRKPSFRSGLYADYKATRKPMPPDLRIQIPLIMEIVRARSLPLIEADGVEADDVIATLARLGSAAGLDVVIFSPDKDMKQALGDHVKIYDTRKDAFYGAEDFKAEYGIEPGLLPDLFGLTGDKSDNIPGIDGIGPKKGLELMQRFGSLEAVLENPGQAKGAKIQEALRSGADSARLSRDLAVLKTDVELPLKIEDLAFSDDEAAAAPLYRSLGFHSLVKVEVEDPARRRYETVGRKGLEGLARLLASAREFSFDTETTGVDHASAGLVGMSFSVEEGSAFYVPVMAPDFPEAPAEEQALKALGPALENEAIGKIGHNAKFDAAVMLRRGVRVRGISFDTMIAAYLLNPGRRSLSLDSLTGEILGLSKIPISTLIGAGKEQVSLSAVPAAKVSEYSCEDADMALRLKRALAPELEASELTKVFQELEMPLVPLLAGMECAGIRVLPEVLARLDSEMDVMLSTLHAKVLAAAGEEFNLNSPKQLQKILFEKLKLPVLRKTKTGPSTDADVLEELAGLHPLPALLSEHRTVKKLQGTYVRALPSAINPRTGRIHASFNQTIAATGRLSSSDPNLQNIPARGALGARIREAFVPAEGRLFLAADYSQVELRIMAHLSGDPEMVRAFSEGEDIHSTLARTIFGAGAGEVTGEMRAAAKAVNFGILYGKTAFGLSKELGISNDEASRFIEAYFERFRGAREYTESIVESARAKGMVRTMLGRLRQIPDIGSENKQRRLAAERTAVNTVIQGSAADLIKLAMIAVCRRIEREGLEAELLLQIHDELHFEVAEAAVERVRRAVVEEMEGAMKLRVPLKVDHSVGTNWMDL